MLGEAGFAQVLSIDIQHCHQLLSLLLNLIPLFTFAPQNLPVRSLIGQEAVSMWLVFQQLTLKLDGTKFDYYDSAIIYIISLFLSIV